MITGDNARTANAVAEQLGLDDVVAEVLPDGKVAVVRDLQARFGRPPASVGKKTCIVIFDALRD
jgi:cation transport ATPase